MRTRSLIVVSSILINFTYATTWITKYSDQVYDYSNNKVQGVNLGGWLVLEPYITPSLFKEAALDKHNSSTIPVDEYHFCKYLGYNEASKILEKHWSTFIVEDDIKTIKSWGLNMVRLPMGYWQFMKLNSDPYVSGRGEYYLDSLIIWCRKYNIKIWIDLHGVPGSQNGYDNSGLRDVIDWQITNGYVDFSLEVLQFIMEKYGNSNYYDVISGIQLVNEPLGSKLDMKKLTSFYEESYAQLRHTNSLNTMVIHDAFKSAGYWDKFLKPNVTVNLWSNYTVDSNLSTLNSSSIEEQYIGEYYNILVDHHRYEVFGVDQLKESLSNHLNSLKEFINPILQEDKQKVIGEWSAALTDCAPWLNGVGRGSRYDGTFDSNEKLGSCKFITDYSNWNLEQRLSTRKFIEFQLDLYNQTEGWIFWCYKTEHTIDWDMKRLIKYNLFPQPLNDRWFDKDSTDLTRVSSNSNSIFNVSFTNLLLCISLVYILTIY